MTAADPLLPSGIESPLGILYPELNEALPPTWLEEGIRASYTGNVALSTKYENQFGSSADGKLGYGIAQIDVVGLSDGNVATTNTFYSPMPPHNTYKLIWSLGGVGPAGHSTFWCNPDVLATISDQSSDNLVVQHLPYVIDGENYATIRFDCISGDNNNIIAMVYDLQTGLLLYHTVNTGTEEIRKGYVNTIVTSGTSGYYQIKNLRKMEIPWALGSLPSFVTPGSIQHLTGIKEITIPGAIGGPSSFPRQQTITFGEVYDRFVSCRIDIINQDVITSSDTINMVSGIGQFTGLFIPPQAAGVGTGLLDSDPDTGMQISITQNDGSGIVLMKTNGVDQQSSYWYDTSGKLLQMVTETISASSYGQNVVERLIYKNQ
jgi:hypothetical protein